MSAPAVQSLSPAAGEVDVVLGRSIEVLFDQPVDPGTVSSKTFSLMGPGQTGVVDASEISHSGSKVQTGREYVSGVFSFPAPAAGDTWLLNQKLVFTPGRSLRPNVTYTVLIVGRGSLLASSFIQNPAGEPVAKSVQYTFVTGELDLSVTPLQCPIPATNAWERPALAPAGILVRPRKVIGNDLTQTIELVFPGPIDVNSFDPKDIVVAGEPFLNDPETQIPDGSNSVVVVDGNRILITISWGPEPASGFGTSSGYSAPGESGPAPDASDFDLDDPQNNPLVHLS
jgi:hypothetical protein